MTRASTRPPALAVLRMAGCRIASLAVTSVLRLAPRTSTAAAVGALLLLPMFGAGLLAQSAAPTVTVPILGVDTVLDSRAKAVSSRLRCPVCQGESIQDSPAELAAQMKSLVREQLVSGRSEAQVFEYFTAKYGQWILLEPKAEGINLLVYWLPVMFLVVGAGGIVFAVKRWTRPVVVADPTPPTP